MRARLLLFGNKEESAPVTIERGNHGGLPLLKVTRNNGSWYLLNIRAVKAIYPIDSSKNN